MDILCPKCLKKDIKIKLEKTSKNGLSVYCWGCNTVWNKNFKEDIFMTSAYRIWHWLTDYQDEDSYSGWQYYYHGYIANPIRAIISVSLVVVCIWIIFQVFTFLPKEAILVICLILILVISNKVYKERKRSERIEDKYDGLLTSIQKKKSREYLKNNIKIIASKIQPDEATGERNYYLYVTIRNSGESTVFYLDLRLRLYDKHGHWLKEINLSIPECIPLREEKEVKVMIFNEKYPYPKMSQFKELKLKLITCSIFKNADSHK